MTEPTTGPGRANALPISRRSFVGRLGVASAALAAAGARSSTAAVTAPAVDGRIAITDVNVSLFHWPFRRLPLDETSALADKMTECGVASAWAGNFEGLLHRDVAGVNQRLADECANSNGRFVPFGTINLSLPDWEEDLRRCHEVHHMPGIRLHPNYHGYSLTDPAAASLLAAAGRRKLLVQLAVTMEDARTQHPLVSVPDVDLRPLSELLQKVGNLRVMILNAGRTVPAAVMKSLAAIDSVYFDMARVENTRGVATFMSSLPAGRVLFGTHAPFLNYEAALIKVFESPLAIENAERLLHENARALLGAR